MACVKVRKKGWSFLLIGIGLAINAFVAPFSFGLSFMATDGGGGFLDQILLFLLCQSIPLLILFICVLVYFIIKGVNQTISK